MHNFLYKFILKRRASFLTSPLFASFMSHNKNNDKWELSQTSLDDQKGKINGTGRRPKVYVNTNDLKILSDFWINFK